MVDVKKLREMDYDTVLHKFESTYDTLDENGQLIVDTIADSISENGVDVDFFIDRDVDELNEFFGGHDDVMIDDRTRDCLIYFREWMDLYEHLAMAYENALAEQEESKGNEVPL